MSYEKEKVHRELMRFFGLKPDANVNALLGTQFYPIYLYVMGMRQDFENRNTALQNSLDIKNKAKGQIDKVLIDGKEYTRADLLKLIAESK